MTNGPPSRKGVRPQQSVSFGVCRRTNPDGNRLLESYALLNRLDDRTTSLAPTPPNAKYNDTLPNSEFNSTSLASHSDPIFGLFRFLYSLWPRPLLAETITTAFMCCLRGGAKGLLGT
ncbi:hypothetical protein Q1695_011156 [Nippostrongylus brasiliensis]|nr:hypothetical protein Q1695_011156 [Nippostrongylus brasiliensis]